MTYRARRRLDLALCLGVGLFYLLNVCVLRGCVGGAPGWFLACYANDVVAGLAICAWLDLLLSLGRLPPADSWRVTVPFLLLCALVWEVLAPLWKPEAVGDPWDLLAYQAGGLLWLALCRRLPPGARGERS